ncbi:hypothetical protein [Candidatus Nitrospira nitrificans]|uniref:Uncharacterized protein n=1 Tax=Candidatus Nitrospira nitrificans TaxID=1742973 RepID=A0A0S4LIF9_9BACT|nr:hypothetical protein [Candidatus Nitrospira nitrificans]CUS37383.1 conserved hypothetical protein [Candidatus Nitrospira nitrificans]
MLYCTAMELGRIGFARPPAIVWLIVLAVAVVGCPSKTIRYPAEHERLLRIDQAVESLRSAYQRKDQSGFHALLLPADQLNELRQQAEMDFAAFSTISLEFKIERVTIEKDDINVLIHWQGTWKRDAADMGVRHRGLARLQWVGTNSILLRGAQGDLPFGMKTKQMLSEPLSSPPQPR